MTTRKREQKEITIGYRVTQKEYDMICVEMERLFLPTVSSFFGYLVKKHFKEVK